MSVVFRKVGPPATSGASAREKRDGPALTQNRLPFPSSSLQTSQPWLTTRHGRQASRFLALVALSACVHRQTWLTLALAQAIKPFVNGGMSGIGATFFIQPLDIVKACGGSSEAARTLRSAARPSAQRVLALRQFCGCGLLRPRPSPWRGKPPSPPESVGRRRQRAPPPLAQPGLAAAPWSHGGCLPPRCEPLGRAARARLPFGRSAAACRPLLHSGAA